MGEYLKTRYPGIFQYAGKNGTVYGIDGRPCCIGCNLVGTGIDIGIGVQETLHDLVVFKVTAGVDIFVEHAEVDMFHALFFEPREVSRDMDALKVFKRSRDRFVDLQVFRQVAEYGDQPVVAFFMPLAVVVAEYITGYC